MPSHRCCKRHSYQCDIKLLVGAPETECVPMTQIYGVEGTAEAIGDIISYIMMLGKEISCSVGSNKNVSKFIILITNG